MDKLERSANSSFERDVVGEEDDSFLLSSNNMKALAELQKDVSIFIVSIITAILGPINTFGEVWHISCSVHY